MICIYTITHYSMIISVYDCICIDLTVQPHFMHWLPYPC